jgi:hypothetical protein
MSISKVVKEHCIKLSAWQTENLMQFGLARGRLVGSPEQGCAEQAGQGADCAGARRTMTTLPGGREEGDRGGGEHAARQARPGQARGRRKPMIAPIGCRAGAVEEGEDAGLPRRRSKWRAPSRTKEKEGRKAIEACQQRPADPGGRVADHGDGVRHRAGVTWPSATALRNCGSVIQWKRSTASPCISGTITKPPP